MLSKRVRISAFFHCTIFLRFYQQFSLILGTGNFFIYKREIYAIIIFAGKMAAIQRGGVAQLGERTVRIRKVESSILFVSTKRTLHEHLLF